VGCKQTNRHGNRTQGLAKEVFVFEISVYGKGSTKWIVYVNVELRLITILMKKSKIHF
jgi:hypothetical protein